MLLYVDNQYLIHHKIHHPSRFCQFSHTKNSTSPFLVCWFKLALVWSGLCAFISILIYPPNIVLSTLLSTQVRYNLESMYVRYPCQPWEFGVAPLTQNNLGRDNLTTCLRLPKQVASPRLVSSHLTSSNSSPQSIFFYTTCLYILSWFMGPGVILSIPS